MNVINQLLEIEPSICQLAEDLGISRQMLLRYQCGEDMGEHAICTVAGSDKYRRCLPAETADWLNKKMAKRIGHIDRLSRTIKGHKDAATSIDKARVRS